MVGTKWGVYRLANHIVNSIQIRPLKQLDGCHMPLCYHPHLWIIPRYFKGNSQMLALTQTDILKYITKLLPITYYLKFLNII